MLCVFTALFSNCKKSEIAEEKGLTNKHNGLAYAGDKVYDVLGYGYDVTGRVANSESSRLQILDVNKYVSENPGLYLPNDHVQEYFEYSYGENVSSYSNKLTQKYKATLDLGLLKNIRLFKAEISASFARKDSSSSKYVYASIRKMIKQKSMRIFYSSENLINNYLTDQFKSDLLTLSAATLIERYGTHVLTDIELGARLDMNYEAQTNNTKREDAATAGVNITAWKVFNVTGDVATNNVDASSNFNQTLYYNTVGGDGTKGLIGELTLDNSSPKINIGNWQSSCNRDNAALIKIGNDGLIPIEDLISDPAKKAEVKNYLIQYYLDHQIKMIDEDVTPINPLNEGKLLQTPDGKVFSVMNGKARHIQDYGTLQAVYNYETVIRVGFNYKIVSNIRQIPNLASEGLTAGATIPPGAELLRDSGNGKIYFYERTSQGAYMLRYITSPDVANRYYFKLSNARNISGTYGYVFGDVIQ